jgi:calcineurin-like phosphoesterase family protein
LTELFFVSDTHFGHANILTFRGLDGELIRPGFSSVEEMDELMVENWNKVVPENAHVYHLGDVCFGKAHIHKIMPRLKGKLRLVVGNHDTYDMIPIYLQYFDKVLSERRFDPFLFTHRPVRLASFEPKTKVNVHGHIHEKNIDEDPRYINVSVERTGYAPVSYDWLVETARGRGIDLEI